MIGARTTRTCPRAGQGGHHFTTQSQRKVRQAHRRSSSAEDRPHAHAARGDLHRRLGRRAEARAAFEQASTLTTSEPEQRYLQNGFANSGEGDSPFGDSGFGEWLIATNQANGRDP